MSINNFHEDLHEVVLEILLEQASSSPQPGRGFKTALRVSYETLGTEIDRPGLYMGIYGEPIIVLNHDKCGPFGVLVDVSEVLSYNSVSKPLDLPKSTLITISECVHNYRINYGCYLD